jgi:hypothetical protein
VVRNTAALALALALLVPGSAGAGHELSRAGPDGRLRVLATGDSMIQIVDSYLKQRLDGARVRSDAQVSTGISKPWLLDWRAYSRRQARRLRPDVTVMFIGANDGFAMGGIACCGRPWIAEYARRARRMMRTYARDGRARVYWLLLPLPRGGPFPGSIRRSMRPCGEPPAASRTTCA